MVKTTGMLEIRGVSGSRGIEIVCDVTSIQSPTGKLIQVDEKSQNMIWYANKI